MTSSRPDSQTIVSVCQASLPEALEDPRWEACLTDEEKSRAARYVVDPPRHQFIVGRGMLRHILAHELGAEPSSIEFATGPHGKPELLRRTDEDQLPLHFNVSHSHDMIVVAWTRAGTVGVDVEKERSEAATEAIARRYFSTREVDELLELPTDERVAAFFRCWTRKEAYLKLHGSGLSFPLGDFAVRFVGDPALVWHRHEPAETSRWQLVDLSAGLSSPGYAGAVIAETGFDVEWVRQVPG